MEVRTDDALQRIDQHWLGPPQFTLPWTATYAQYAMLSICLLAEVVLFKIFDLSLFTWAGVWGGVIAVILVQCADKFSSFGHGLIPLFRAVHREISAHRAPTPGRAVRIAQPPAPVTFHHNED